MPDKIAAERLLYLIRSGLYESDITADGMLVFKPMEGVPGTIERFYIHSVLYIELSDGQLQEMRERLSGFLPTLPVMQTPVITNWLRDTLDDQINPRASGGPVTPGLAYDISAGSGPEEFHLRPITSFDEAALRRAVEESIKKLAALYGSDEETPDDNPTE